MYDLLYDLLYDLYEHVTAFTAGINIQRRLPLLEFYILRSCL